MESQQQANFLHEIYYEILNNFEDIQEIEFVQQEQMEIMIDQNERIYQTIFNLKCEKVLLISFDFFDQFYQFCFEKIINYQKAKEDTFNELQIYSKVILLMNGEINTAINLRYFLLNASFIKDLENENLFMKALLFKNKKASATFAYRYQVLIKLIQQSSQDKVKMLLDQERTFIYKYLDRFPRNYYINIYRVKLVEYLKINHQNVFDQFIKEETVQCMKYSERNLFDNSSYTYIKYMSQYFSQEELNKILTWAQQLFTESQKLYDQQELQGTKKFQSIKQFIQIMQK